MVCLGCLMAEDQPQWFVDLHLGPPSPSNLAVLASGSWSFCERDGVLFHSHCWLGLPHMLLLWPSTCSVHVTFHMLCCWDLLHSVFTVDGTFHILCWWGPSTCNVNGTFYMQCWWDLPNTLMMGWRDLFHAAASWVLIEQQWSKKRKRILWGRILQHNIHVDLKVLQVTECWDYSYESPCLIQQSFFP